MSELSDKINYSILLSRGLAAEIPALPPVTVYTTVSGLRLRSSPSISGTILTSMPLDTKVVFTKATDGAGKAVAPATVVKLSETERQQQNIWVETAYGSHTGWCASWYLTTRVPSTIPEPPNHSLLGPHINETWDSHFGLIRNSNCRAVLVNLELPKGIQLARYILDNMPDTYVVTRNVGREKNPKSDNPARLARLWWDETRATDLAALGNLTSQQRKRLILTAQNEKGLTSESVAFERACVLLADEYGYRWGAFNLAVGHPPDMDAWKLAIPLFEEMNAKGHVLCLHEYFQNTPQDWMEGDEGWLIRRHRKLWREHILPRKLYNIRLFITETGQDNIAGMDGEFHGWRTRMDASTYMRYLIDIDRMYREDFWVIGAAIFCHGAINKNQWKNFEIAPELVEPLYGYIRSQNA